MRELKFRSWNKEYKRFYYFKNGLYYNNIKCIGDGFISNSLFDWENAEAFISIYDKNWKEIYAGDIVNIAGRGFCIVFWSEDLLGYEFRLAFKRDFAEDYQSILEDSDSLDIIGNIHEK